ncbi:hypothetical protein HBH61_137380 [Parastagonospora nodorum]|nr:hypothetical protein HBH61_137380 [Parastagonospora nodorum]
MDNTINQSSEDREDPFSFMFASDPIATDTVFQDGGLSELSAALTAAHANSFQTESPWLSGVTPDGISNNSTAFSSPLTPGTPITRPKLGSRFSREVIRTLKTWLAAHQQHPYPRDDDMELLQLRTGLNQAQLTNWFANARRRGKVQGARPVTPRAPDSSSNPVDIIQRPGTPAIRQDSRAKDPLQRWVDSPPEHEPADVGDIARAMASSSRSESGINGVKGYDYADNDQWRSPYISSASSAGTSQSSEVSTHRSSGSQSSLKARRAARRKRTPRRRPLETDLSANPSMPYQCTFCTDTFKTKYDWQRHEKSLHLPLEKWVCALHGPRAPKPQSAEMCCVFCGESDPAEAHIESHHFSLCQDRTLEERTFHRKDHLVQHLRLVHQAKYEAWSMKDWMVPMPDIKSRCGFCGAEMTKWEERTDHLAEHFRNGSTMEGWKGDWGFEESTRRLVESAVPPYFIHYERNTLVPMRATDTPWGSPPNGYELVKIEIEFFIQNYIDIHSRLPSNDDIQVEACRIIFAAESAPDANSSVTSTLSRESWLRDVIMASPELTRRARFGPLRTSSESRHSPMKINGKEHLFEDCPFEARLRAFVVDHHISGTSLVDGQLQTQMCTIVREMERVSNTPSDMYANWIMKCICSGNWWLQSFKQRAGVVSTTDPSIALPEVHLQRAHIDWIQSTFQSLSYFDAAQNVTQTQHNSLPLVSPDLLPPKELNTNMTQSVSSEAQIIPLTQTTMFDMRGKQQGFLPPEDTNYFRIFESDMRRWVAATMSPKNPNCHVPSDQEIQHQARWIMYDGDDPWNQTPADYSEWLWRFKEAMGISHDENAGMPTGST